MADKPTVLSETLVRQSSRKPIDDPYTYCAGWAFHVPLPAFWAALDIAASERIYEQVLSDGKRQRVTKPYWSIGTPPAYDFTPGDVFHAPPTIPAQWIDQLTQLTHTIQIKSIEIETLTIGIMHHRENRMETRQVSQAEFAALLQFGLSEGQI